MSTLKSEALSGKNNKRLNSTVCTISDLTEARANIASEMPQSKVTMPSALNVDENKDWVDNGSLL